MSARIMDDFQVLHRYRVMVLDRDAQPEAAHYRINGVLYDPVPIHGRSENDTMPRNFIAIRSTQAFKGATVEFLCA